MCKKLILNLSNHTQKVTLSGSYANVRANTIKRLEENLAGTFL